MMENLIQSQMNDNFNQEISNLSIKLETNTNSTEMLNLFSSKSLKLLEMKASPKHSSRTELKHLSLMYVRK